MLSAILALSGPAMALDTAPVLVPGGALVVGQPGVVELFSPDLDGDVRIRAHSETGRTGAVELVGGGLARVTVTPRQEGPLRLELSGKDSSGPWEASVEVPTVAAWRGPLGLKPERGVVDAGERAAVALAVEPGGNSPRDAAERRLLLRHSEGQLAAVQAGDGGWTTSWTAPKTLEAPAFALVTAVDAGAPSTTLGWATIAVRTPVTLSYEVRPGDACTLDTGDTKVEGTADGGGVLTLTVPLHPGAPRAELHCQGPTPGDTLHRAVGLPAGQDPWVGWFPLPDRVPGGRTVPVLVLAIEDDGSPRTDGTLPRITATAGSVGEGRWRGPGVAEFAWTPPAAPGPVELTATLRDRSAVLRTEVVADPPTGTSSLPAARLVAWSDSPRTPSNTAVAWVAALDANGLPVPRTALALSTDGASQKGKATVLTNSQGLARVDLTLDDGVGVSSLTATAAGLRASAPVLRTPAAGPDPVGTLDDLDRAWTAVARGSLGGQGAAPWPSLPSPSDDDVAVAGLADAAALAVDEGPAAARPSAERSVLEQPRARISLSIATVPHTYHQTSQDDGGMVNDAQSAQGDLLAFDPLGAPALDLRARFQFWKAPLWVDGRVQGRGERYQVQGATYERLDAQAALGLRVTVVDIDSLELSLLAQAEYFRVPLFQYESFRADDPDKAVGAVLFGTDVFGGRTGLATRQQWGIVGLEVEATETFAPYPVHTRVGAGVDFEVADMVALRAGLDLGFRHLTFDLDSDVAKIRDQQHMGSVGITVLLR
ncbi:MAG: hypothetical protein H6742_07510 [Alphaproteobacteria bacterium]|nr:hypothetical protein [Alphaproteobacteria bacterium]